MEFALAIYDIEKHGRQASFYGGHDPCVCCFAFKSLTTWICGNFDLAERCGKQALQLSLQLKQPGSLAHAQQLNFKLDMFKRDAAATAVKAKALIELATMHGFRLPLAIAMMALGWSTAKQGDVETGVAQAKESIDALDRMGARTSQSLYYAMLAEVLHNAGQADAADRFLDAAFRHCSVHDERFYEAELWTLRGRFFWFRDRKRTDDIEQCFQRALRVARQQGARAWELRAATGLARLWADQGRQTEASTLLRPILAWYSDDDCIADILDARSLLVELS
jgi:tetratricopeptide (TPR) repeat protein